MFLNRMVKIDNGSVFPASIAPCNSGVALLILIGKSNPAFCKADPSSGEITDQAASNVSGPSEMKLWTSSLESSSGKDSIEAKIPETSGDWTLISEPLRKIKNIQNIDLD